MANPLGSNSLIPVITARQFETFRTNLVVMLIRLRNGNNAAKIQSEKDYRSY